MSLLDPFLDWVTALDRLPDALRGITAGPLSDPPKGARLRLIVPPEAVLWREIPTPDVPQDRRSAWIEARLEPLSPWAPGAYLWAEEPHGALLRIALTAAAPIRAAEAQLQARGQQLVELQLGALRLRSDTEGRLRRARAWALGWALAMGCGAVLALGALWQTQQSQAAADLAAQRLARHAAEASVQGNRARAVLELAKDQALNLIDLLNRLALGLPLDSHLFTLRLTAQEFQITGQSAAPEGIVPALQAHGFQGVDFAGASSLDGTTGLYSFTLHGLDGAAK